MKKVRMRRSGLRSGKENYSALFMTTRQTPLLHTPIVGIGSFRRPTVAVAAGDKRSLSFRFAGREPIHPLQLVLGK